MAVAGLIFSILILRSRLFGRATAAFGLIANALDLAYCLAFVFTPAERHPLLSVCFIPAAGLFFMLWHILIGWRLCRLGTPEKNKAPDKDAEQNQSTAMPTAEV